MKPNVFQEADGAWSMRRILAFFFSLAAIGVLSFGAWRGTIEAVYAGGALLLSVIVLLFFTTWGDVAEIVASWKGKG